MCPNFGISVQLLLPFLLLRGRKGGGVGVPGALRRVPTVKQYQDEYLLFFWCYLCCNGHRDITVISLSYFAGFSPNRFEKYITECEKTLKKSLRKKAVRAGKIIGKL